MSDRGDVDDWFAEPEPVRPRRRDVAGEVTLGDETAVPPRPGRVSLRALPRGGQLALAVAAIVVLLLVLWGVGAFAGGGSAPAQLSTSSTQAASTAVSTPAAAPIPAPTSTLTPGSSGPQVRRLQRALVRLGYSPGRVDGSYGPATENALKRFQTANGLQPDGVLGPKTLRALRTKLAAG